MPWQHYMNSGCQLQIFETRVAESKLFANAENRSFTEVAVELYEHYQATLIAVKRGSRLLINPGRTFSMSCIDMVYYRKASKCVIIIFKN